MIAFLLIILAQYCSSIGDTRVSLFDEFLELDTNDKIKQFLTDCEGSTEFVCHVNGMMDRACFDVYAHYFKVVGSASFQDYDMSRRMHQSGIYYEPALQHMIVKSISDDNPSLLVGAVVIFEYSLMNYQILQSIELTVFNDGPEWTARFNKLQKKHNLLNYALYCKSVNTFMMLYSFVGRQNNFVLKDKSQLKYNGFGFRELFRYPKQVLPKSRRDLFIELFPYLEQALPERGIWNWSSYIFEYFCNLSTTKYDTQDQLILNEIKQVAELYLRHYYFSRSNIFTLLKRSDLKNFSTLEYLKSRIRDQVMANCFEPQLYVTDFDVFYKNIDLVTDGECRKQLKLKFETNGYSDALWRSYRGAAILALDDIANSKLILTYCTSENTCRLVYHTLKGVTKELDNKQYLAAVLSQYGIEYTLLALSVTWQMSRDDANEVIGQAKNTFALASAEIKKFDTEITRHILQYMSDKLLKYVDDIINNRAVCGLCNEVIDSSYSDSVRVLPCGHVIHTHHNKRRAELRTCSICRQIYYLSQAVVINI